MEQENAVMETEVEETTGQKHKTICVAVGVTVTSGADFGMDSIVLGPTDLLRSCGAT